LNCPLRREVEREHDRFDQYRGRGKPPEIPVDLLPVPAGLETAAKD